MPLAAEYFILKNPLGAPSTPMRTFLSSQNLETMGIQIWHPRYLLPGSQQALDFAAYTLHDATGKQVGVLCLESQFIPVGTEAPLFRLLDAMLSAIKLKRVPLLENAISEEAQFILLMGQSLAQAVLASEEPLDVLRSRNIHAHSSGAKLLVTYHPLDLLLEPLNKAKAWEDLKKVPSAL